MSLLKIPLILLQVVGLHVTLTSPNPRPAWNERVKSRHIVERYMKTIVVYGVIDSVKYVPSIVGLAEIAVLLANRYPSHSASPVILKNLLFRRAGITNTMGLTGPAIIGTILAIMGGAIRFWCYRTLDQFFTFELSIKPDHRLVTSGPYNFVRHPSYTGGLIAFAGGLLILFAHGGWTRDSGVLGTAVGKIVVASWVAVFSGLVSTIIPRTISEDKMMKEKFGKEWEEWAKRVRWRVIPGVY